ncbi:hypothetical protein, variant [Aphanomyces invadans]|uniref:WRKY19-like zinc finger domain-containing protein n=1 Tax=Aphanomyces invadans TaxID=157072 RepID=A0A024U0G8_9STRA|nr:hypothetical protein, variant [Aphanomyces invadans]ETV99729.1 hypothetical protein, variant [Aphanomyces invadans]|eukprot:XP_008871505.1 hypothetical protein, variant [Aphanomyces invadans]
MTTPLDALSGDMEIVELLSTVFSEEYTRGVAASAHAAATPPPDTRPRKVCQTDGCHRTIVSKGSCIRHGGGKRCQVDKCDIGAKSNGVCWKHGGSRTCKWSDCTNHSKARGLCWTHGGGKPCATPDCNRTSLQGGHCWAHGGGTSTTRSVAI